MGKISDVRLLYRLAHIRCILYDCYYMGLFGWFICGGDGAVLYNIFTVVSLMSSSVVISQSQCGSLAIEGLIVPEVANSTLLLFTVYRH